MRFKKNNTPSSPPPPPSSVSSLMYKLCTRTSAQLFLLEVCYNNKIFSLSLFVLQKVLNILFELILLKEKTEREKNRDLIKLQAKPQVRKRTIIRTTTLTNSIVPSLFSIFIQYKLRTIYNIEEDDQLNKKINNNNNNNMYKIYE